MKFVSETPPLAIELVNYWPPGRWQCILDIDLKLVFFEVKLFTISLSAYRRPFDIRLEVALFGFSIEVANSE